MFSDVDLPVRKKTFQKKLQKMFENEEQRVSEFIFILSWRATANVSEVDRSIAIDGLLTTVLKDTGAKPVLPVPDPRQDHGPPLGALFHGAAWRSRFLIPSLLASFTATRGRFYISGGHDSQFSPYRRDVLSYDPARGGEPWVERRAMSAARAWHCMASPNHLIYAIGGSDNDEGGTERFDIRRVEAYDPLSGQWTAAQQRGGARRLGRPHLRAGGLQLGEHGVLQGHAGVRPRPRRVGQRTRPAQVHREALATASRGEEGTGDGGEVTHGAAETRVRSSRGTSDVQTS